MSTLTSRHSGLLAYLHGVAIFLLLIVAFPFFAIRLHKKSMASNPSEAFCFALYTAIGFLLVGYLVAGYIGLIHLEITQKKMISFICPILYIYFGFKTRWLATTIQHKA